MLTSAKLVIRQLKITNSTSRRTLTTNILKHDAALKFDLSYGFTVLDSDYNETKSLQLVKNDSMKKFKDPAFLFPGFEGKMRFMEPLIANLNRDVCCFQYPFETAPPTVSQYVDILMPLMKQQIKPKQNIKMIAHSFGGLIAMEMIRRLQSDNFNIHLCLLDSSPLAMQYMSMESMSIKSVHDFDMDYIVYFASCMKIDNPQKLRDLINMEDAWPQKLDTFLSVIPQYKSFSKTQMRTVINGLRNAVHSILTFPDQLPKLKSKTTLFRSSNPMLPFPEDFAIEMHFEHPVATTQVKGHHFNMLKYEQTAKLINEALETE